VSADAWGAKPAEHHVRLRAVVEEPTEVAVEFGVSGEAHSIGFVRGLVSAVAGSVHETLRASRSEASAKVLVGSGLFTVCLLIRFDQPESGLAEQVKGLLDGWTIHFAEIVG